MTPVHQPPEGRATHPSFNQALCGLYAAGVGAAAGRRPPRCDPPGPARRAIDEPVVITGARSGLPGTERVFDDGNVARLLHGEQFIDVIPSRARREMVDKHITRLVKGEDGSGTFQTIDDPADVIKLAARAGEFDLAEEFGIDADRIAALGRETQLAIAAGIDALRDAGIPLVQHYKNTTRGHQAARPLAAARRAARRHRRDLRLRVPGLRRRSPTTWTRFWTERVTRARTRRSCARCAPGCDGRRGARRRSTGGSPSCSDELERAPVPLRPALPVPRAVDGALAVRRADRRARTEHADQRGVREHDAGASRWPRTGSARGAAAA